MKIQTLKNKPTTQYPERLERANRSIVGAVSGLSVGGHTRLNRHIFENNSQTASIINTLASFDGKTQTSRHKHTHA